MELRTYLNFLRKRWSSITVIVLLGIIASSAVTFLTERQYRAETQIFVTSQDAANANEQLQGDDFIQQRVLSYRDVVLSRRVLEDAIGQAGVATTPGDLEPRVEADAPFNTVGLFIRVTDTSPEDAAKLANAITSSFIGVVPELERGTGAQATSPVRIRVIDSAVVPTVPVSPNVLLNLALGVLGGLVLGVGFAVLRETADTRVRGADDVASTGLTLLGQVPVDLDATPTSLVVREDPRGVHAESFRQVRTNLQFVTAASSARSVTVTSSVEGEGKTTVAANLALTLADAGLRVALVDADLRRPRVAAHLGLEGAAGLTTVLIGRATLADVVQPYGDRGALAVLASGDVPPNPSELLASEGMRKLLREMEDDYDIVLIDSAPLLPVTDSAVLAASTGGTLLVVGSGVTKRQHVARSIDTLGAVDARILGVVLNRVELTRAEAYALSYADTDADRARRPSSHRRPQGGADGRGADDVQDLDAGQDLGDVPGPAGERGPGGEPGPGSTRAGSVRGSGDGRAPDAVPDPRTGQDADTARGPVTGGR